MVLAGNRTSIKFNTQFSGSTVSEKLQTSSQNVDSTHKSETKNVEDSSKFNQSYKQENKRKIPKKYERSNSFQLEHRSPEEKRHRPYAPSDDARDVSGIPYSFSNQYCYHVDIPGTIVPGRIYSNFEQMEPTRRQDFCYPRPLPYPYQPPLVSQPLTPMHSDELSSAITLASMASESPSPVKVKPTLSQFSDLKDGNDLTVPGLQVPTNSMSNRANTLKLNDCKNEEWICDFCRSAKFSTFDEACAHEKICEYNDSARKSNEECNDEKKASELTKHYSSRMPSKERRLGQVEETFDLNSVQCFHGSAPLSVQPTDKEWLSELNCYIRSHCVEAFSAEKDDVTCTTKRGRISFGQVGVRCVFCEGMRLKERSVGSVSFPVSVSGIYESVKRWHKVHFEVCEHIPPDVRTKIMRLSLSSEWVPTTRQYWSDSAKALGIADTVEGLRFLRDPKSSNNDIATRNSMLQTRFTSSRLKKTNDIQGLTSSTETGSMYQTQKKNGDYIVYEDDEGLIPSYVYYLFRQVQLCHFEEADRFAARSKCTVGYAGIECRHCGGHAALGKYFPSSSKGLSTNSTSQNIHSHLMKCRRCPQEVKDKLNALKKEKYYTRRTCGWRQSFFETVWKRMHEDNAD